MAEASLNQRLSKLKNQYKTFTQTKYIPTGSLIMDTVMGGGLPVGKMIELASDSGAGKTTIVLSMCRDMLRQGKKIIYLDHEGAVTTSQLEGIGVAPYLYDEEENPDGTFFLFQVMTHGDSETIIDSLVGTGDISLIVIDSITAMIPDEYLANAAGSGDKSRSITNVMPAEDARILGKFIRKLKALCTKYNTSSILINQLRTNLNITGGMSTKVSTGGASIEFFPDIRLRLEKPKLVYQKRLNALTGEVEEQPVGCTASIYAYKNKLTAGKIKVPITIVFGRGISNLLSYKQWLPNKKIIVDGEEVPMLLIKGGGYSVLTLKDGTQYNARGEEKLTELIKDHFNEIKSCFTSEDFQITENKAFAEYDDNGNRIVEEEPGDEIVIDNTVMNITIEEDYLSTEVE